MYATASAAFTHQYWMATIVVCLLLFLLRLINVIWYNGKFFSSYRPTPNHVHLMFIIRAHLNVADHQRVVCLYEAVDPKGLGTEKQH